LGIVVRYLEVSVESAHLLKMQTRMEDSILFDRPAPAPDIKETLAELSRQYCLAVISDTGLTPGRTLRRLLQEDGLVEYFTHLTFSDEVGRSKPHPDNFIATLKALNVSPAEAVHVGDMLRTDIAGAQGVGMRGVQYIGLSQDKPSSQVTPDAVIRRYIELAEVLDRWNNSNE
jgi:putative hydrolase of the HAD superfamily